MRHFAAALLVMAAAPLAQSADPLHSKECAVARAELDAALDEAAAARQPRSRRLAAARSAAADACLGPSSGKAERSGAPDVVRSVPAPAMPAAPITPPPAVVTVAPPLSVPRPATITACDPAGCWDSEGRRLNQVGPQFIGPRGPCILLGGAVSCP
jgi:hypothetical protein